MRFPSSFSRAPPFRDYKDNGPLLQNKVNDRRERHWIRGSEKACEHLGVLPPFKDKKTEKTICHKPTFSTAINLHFQFDM